MEIQLYAYLLLFLSFSAKYFAHIQFYYFCTVMSERWMFNATSDSFCPGIK